MPPERPPDAKSPTDVGTSSAPDETEPAESSSPGHPGARGKRPTPGHALDRLRHEPEAREVVSEQLRVWARADPANPSLRRVCELAGRLKVRPKG